MDGDKKEVHEILVHEECVRGRKKRVGEKNSMMMKDEVKGLMNIVIPFHIGGPLKLSYYSCHTDTHQISA